MAVNQQPQSPKSSRETEEYLLQLDPTEINKWTVSEVCSQFLDRTGFGYLNENFTVNNITGRVLLMIEERNLVEMGINVVGDRLILMSYLKMLKKKKVENDKMATLWSGETPASGVQYAEDGAQCCGKIFCPCCITRKFWRITGQGIFYRIVPPCSCIQTVTQEYIDFRFLKDMELRSGNTCLCCCMRHQLLLYAENASKHNDETVVPTEHHLVHPEADKVETVVRNAWSNARLVAD